jgi:D-alanine-D-alanine ligase
MLRLALIFGGRSAEHEISLASARFVADSLPRDRYELVPVGIMRDGRWVRPRDLDVALADGLEAGACDEVALSVDPSRPGLQLPEGGFVPLDFAFPMLHGTFAEDGTIQGLLEMAGLAYAGAGVAGSSVGMDKELMKAVFAAEGLPQVGSLTLRGAEACAAETVERVERRFAYPVFVKPCNLGSSVGMTKAHDRVELAAALALAARYDRKVIIEEAIVGREFECSLLGNDEPRASVPGEVAAANEFYDYEAKYTDGMMSFTIPAPLSAEETHTLQDLAVRAFRAVDCAGFARCDFFREHGSGRILVNEINTIPGMTRFSAFPMLWEASGLSGPALIDEIVRLGLERHAERRALLTTR